jgi:site-specific DNA-cytosine methylase
MFDGGEVLRASTHSLPTALSAAGYPEQATLRPVRPAPTLFPGHRAPPAHFDGPRSITVREAAKLQGFPDTFRVHGSFVSQMEQMTDAVPPPRARAVLCVLVETASLGYGMGTMKQGVDEWWRNQ